MNHAGFSGEIGRRNVPVGSIGLISEELELFGNTILDGASESLNVTSPSSDVTTFSNPMLDKIQLRINGKLYPQIPFANTYDARFFAHMLRASDVRSVFEADPEYINSLMTPIHEKDTNTFTDISSFLMTFQTERSSDNVFFDGLETGNENVNIQFEFHPTTNTNADHFKFAPQIWLLRETYWTADVQNGLRYWAKGTPEFVTEE